MRDIPSRHGVSRISPALRSEMSASFATHTGKSCRCSSVPFEQAAEFLASIPRIAIIMGCIPIADMVHATRHVIFAFPSRLLDEFLT